MIFHVLVAWVTESGHTRFEKQDVSEMYYEFQKEMKRDSYEIKMDNL